MTNTISVKEKYSLEGQYIDPLIGDVVESNGTFALISNLDLMNGDPDLVQKALKQVYDSLYDYQVSEEAMAALGPAAAPVINLSNFYKWVYSSGATDKALQENFIKVLQALITPGGWKLPSTDSNLPFENHSYPMYSDDNDGFVSIGVYLGLGEIDEDDSATIGKLGLNLIVNCYKEYKKNFQDLKTYLEKGTITWTELQSKVSNLVTHTLSLSEQFSDPQYGGLYPNQGKEFESYSKSLEIFKDVLDYWHQNGGATLATTKQFFTLDPLKTYQKYEENYLFAAANARQKVVMIGGEDQLTAALLQDLIIKRGKVLEECTLDLNTVQIYTEYSGATDLMSKAHNTLNTIISLCKRIHESAVFTHHVKNSTSIGQDGEDSVSWAYILEFYSSKEISKAFSENSISKENTKALKEKLLEVHYTYTYMPLTHILTVTVNSQESFANSLHRILKSFESETGTALRWAINEITGGDWNMLYDPLEALEAQLDLIIDYYSKEDAVKALEKKYGANNVEGLKNSIESSLDNAQKNYDEALGYYERLTAPVEYDRLLSLVLMYNPLDGTGQRVTALTKNTDGTYTATLSQGESTSEFSLRGCEEHMSLPYFALAMCYEKMVVVETVIRAHAEEIKDLNAEIIENNNWLKYANGAYQNYYSWAIYSKNGVYADNSSRLWKVISTKAGTVSDENVAMESAKAFLGYLKEECGIKGIDAEKIVHWGDYNTEGKFREGGDTFNIDVEEQGFLTLISNWQEALRQRGDWLSTESQKKTLELTQDFQIYNSACSITSQVCKMVGGPNDAIASNIR